MPQVDKVTFWPQVFWLAAFIILFYVIFLRDYVAAVLNALKTRNLFYLQNIQQRQHNEIQMTAKNVELSFLIQSLLAVTLLQTKQLVATDANDWFSKSLEQQLCKSELVTAAFDGQIALLLEETELQETCNN